MRTSKSWLLSLAAMGIVLMPLKAIAANFTVTAVTVGPLSDGVNTTVNGIAYLNQSLPITDLTANSQNWAVGNFPTTLSLRRSGIGTVANRQVVWGERPSSTPITTLRIPAPTTTEAALNQNNLFLGTDNVFVNEGNTAGNQSDIERVDFIARGGVKVRETRALSILERGTPNSHDGFKIAAITALDSQGLPSAYGSLITIPTGWGQTPLRTTAQNPLPSPSPNPTYTVLNNSLGKFTNTADITGQNVGGVLITLDELAPEKSKIFGYSLFAIDVQNNNNPNNLVDWKNASYFPTNTKEGTTQGGGGIDLLALNVGIARNPDDFRTEVPEPATALGTVFALAFGAVSCRRKKSA